MSIRDIGRVPSSAPVNKRLIGAWRLEPTIGVDPQTGESAAHFVFTPDDANMPPRDSFYTEKDMTDRPYLLVAKNIDEALCASALKMFEQFSAAAPAPAQRDTSARETIQMAASDTHKPQQV